MTAYVTIPVATAQNVLKMPNTALRYKPPMAAEEVLALYKRYGIDEGEGRSVGADSPAEESRSLPRAAQNMPRAPKADTAVVCKLHPENSMEPDPLSLA